MYIINTIIGFLFVALGDIKNRDVESKNSPKKFSWMFFFKDNLIKWVVSLTFSLLLSVALHLNNPNFSNLFGEKLEFIGDLIYIGFGISPEFFFQKLKKKVGLFQPDEVEGYKRNEK